MAGNAMMIGAIALLLWCLMVVGAQDTPARPSVNCDDPVPGSSNYLITDQDDADLLKACEAVQATVLIRTQATNISLDGVGRIMGSLIVTDSPVLLHVSAANLTYIRGNFTLSGLPNFVTFAFESSADVRVGIFWNDLPNFEGASDPSRRLQVLLSPPGLGIWQPDGAPALSITNTQLRNASFLYFSGGTQGSIEVLNNIDLAFINFTGLQTSIALFHVSGNNPSMQLTLPNMSSAGDLIIEDVAGVDFPVLREIKANLTLARNGFKNITFPKLTEVGDWLNIVNNSQLNKTYFTSLRYIGQETSKGGLNIANNERLGVISGFSSLSYMWGSLDLSGPIEYLSFYSSSIPHGYHVNSTISGFDCSTLDRISTVSPTKQKNYCIAMVNGKDTAKHAPRDPAISGKTLGVVVIAPIAAAAFLAWLTWYVLRKRELVKKLELERAAAGGGGSGESELQDVGGRASETQTRRQSGGDDGEVDADGHRLPKYRREARPGEVPPAYVATDTATETRR